jgi:hypothetical protein
MLATNWWPVAFQARADWEEKIERIRIKVGTSFFMVGAFLLFLSVVRKPLARLP